MCALALVYGCGCSAADSGGHGVEHDSLDGDAQSEPETGLCFMIPPGVEEQLPTIRSTAHEAAAAWGVSYGADGCPNWFAVSDELLRAERVAERVTMDSGSTLIRFRRDTLNRIADTVESCGSYMGDDGLHKYQTPLLQILIHEFGHELGFRGDDPQDPSHATTGVMRARQPSGCEVDWPTSSDRSSIDSADD